MTSANGAIRTHVYRTTVDRYAAMEALSPEVRRIICEAKFEWSPQAVLKHIKDKRAGFRSIAEVRATIARWDAEQEAQDRIAVWGRYPTVQDLGLGDIA